MKRPLDDQEMLNLLELAKKLAQQMREGCELATEIALKYQKKMRKIREERASIQESKP